VKEVEMPLIVGWRLSDARRALEKHSLRVEVEYEENDEIAAEVVIEASYEYGDKVPEGSVVILKVSEGPSDVEVVSAIGKTLADAQTALTSQGLKVAVEYGYSENVPEGIVISQNPIGGSVVEPESSVTIVVSQGSSTATLRVPNVIGMAEEEGIKILQNSGLNVTSLSQVNHATIPAGCICYQSYSQGSYVDEGTSLEIKVSQGPEPITYKCNASIEAPTLAEAPDYVAGTEVHILLVPDGGMPLLDTTVTTFPQAANYYGLTASGGTLTMTYKVKLAGTVTEDPETGELINVPGGEETRTITRRIEFLPE